MNKNHRQAYAVSSNAGMQHSAESWGTGRAVARVPRVSGGGTNRSGQGAFANMCRKGRMFAPTKTWRRWHRKSNLNQRRYATCSALAASAVPALVMARGHRIEKLPEVQLVVSSNDVEKVAKTKEAIKLLKALAAYSDVERVIASRSIRSGRGKARNRRHVQRKGPLIVHNLKRGTGTLVHAFRNIPGVDLCNVHHLNLLQLAPGGHLGRFIIWTEGAFRALDKIYGTNHVDAVHKDGYRPPIPILANADITRIINSTEVQSVLRPKKDLRTVHPRRRNPLRNTDTMVKLNPHAVVVKRRALTQAKQKAARHKKVKINRKNFLAVLKTPAVAPERHPAELAINY